MINRLIDLIRKREDCPSSQDDVIAIVNETSITLYRGGIEKHFELNFCYFDCMNVVDVLDANVNGDMKDSILRRNMSGNCLFQLTKWGDLTKWNKLKTSRSRIHKSLFSNFVQMHHPRVIVYTGQEVPSWWLLNPIRLKKASDYIQTGHPYSFSCTGGRFRIKNFPLPMLNFDCLVERFVKYMVEVVGKRLQRKIYGRETATILLLKMLISLDGIRESVPIWFMDEYFLDIDFFRYLFSVGKKLSSPEDSQFCFFPGFFRSRATMTDILAIIFTSNPDIGISRTWKLNLFGNYFIQCNRNLRYNKRDVERDPYVLFEYISKMHKTDQVNQIPEALRLFLTIKMKKTSLMICPCLNSRVRRFEDFMRKHKKFVHLTIVDLLENNCFWPMLNQCIRMRFLEFSIYNLWFNHVDRFNSAREAIQNEHSVFLMRICAKYNNDEKAGYVRRNFLQLMGVEIKK